MMSAFKCFNFTRFASLLALTVLAGACASVPSREPAAVDSQGQNAIQTASVFDPKGQKTWEDHPFTASAEYHYSLGQAYSNEGRVDRAIEEYQAALVYDPDTAVLHGKLAAEYLKKGSNTLAIESCERALKLDPEYSDVRLMLGGIYSMSQETDLAIAQYDAVLKSEPQHDEAAVFKTQVLVEADRLADALKFIRHFVTVAKDSAAAWYYAGKLEQAHQNVTRAIQAYQTALNLRPGFTQAAMALGMIFELQSNTKKAIALYQEQIEAKQDAQVAHRLSTLYLKNNQMELAKKTLEMITFLDPDDLNAQMKIALIYMQQQQWKPAKAMLEVLLKKVPDSDKVHFYLASIEEEQGNWAQAIDLLAKVSVDSKLFEDANLHAAELQRKLFQPVIGIQLLETAIKKSPETASFYLAVASLYEDQKKYTEASDALVRGLKVASDDERMLYYYGSILEKLGKSDQAIVQMEAILSKNPEHADAMNFIAYTWTAQGIRLKDAEELLVKALKIKPKSAFILDSLGWNQFMLGKSKEALRYLETAVTLNSTEATILEHLAEVYMRNQMPERAQATRDRIQNMNRSPASIAD
jgi:tetratricopeptide (TPR) repeat protein